MRDIIIASQLDPSVNARLAQQAQARVIDLPAGDLSVLAPEANVLFVRPFNKAGNASTTQSAARPRGWPLQLDWIQLASVGIDFYPDWLLQGPVVTVARGTASNAIAEYVLAAIFSAAKQIPTIWLKDASPWQRPSLSLVQGSVLGLYGFGSIGRAVAQRALALGMRVVAIRRSQTPFDIEGVDAVADLNELVARADHLVLAAPATPATRHAINQHVLAQAKPGLHLINIARGSLIDDTALLTALDSGRVALATLDVTEPEPLPAGHRYYHHPRVRLSPHISPHTDQLTDALLDKFLGNLQRFRSGQPLTDVLDPARGY
ncbi:phosphoglycerate dehydrogenase-like enzyme [Herbaspirillum sp. Sphag1AN]|uniref:D-isomer specific 2-hydroxyacid dehydrogenase family protein n=1 Tax=unclassified Herbaspirillum TaxID=2624150 RepID=UPI00161D0150|nr:MULTISPECIES: D-isomer specific 2-hydroxyacid dehydrogenase family protein [unclassified Herbaspirillum]MBB3213460.1 phosphoglycerate dehydrogenase-like enzyme [Herbaspirillum sp. Sphag1AN]MBB3246496.1 phosphoglycerate dehydrogenase-like enzyme [Herbaspirillum sp. Sphag64]